MAVVRMNVQGKRAGLEEKATAQEESSTAPGRAVHRHSAQSGMEHRLRGRSVARWHALPGLTILDVYTREGVAIEAGQSLKGEDVVHSVWFQA